MVMSIAAPSTVLAATLHLAGDSTLDDCGFNYPYRSWGREVEPYLKSGNAISNFAKSGHSSRSFDASGYWAKLMAEVKPGDFVVMQFGHNDQKRSTQFYLENRWTAPDGLYKDILRRWVGEVRVRGATPLLVSPICRGTFDKDGKRLVDSTHASSGVCLRMYRDAMASLADELTCDFVDMNTLTKGLMDGLGREEAEKLFVISTGAVQGKDGEPSRDVSHPAKVGAEAFARLFVDDVRARGLSVARLFKNDDFPISDFGAKPDGSKCTEAFAAAFTAAEKAGGGRVVVPEGKWLTGAVRFRSNCELHLEDGAEVVFSQDPDDYLPAESTSWEGMECWNYCPLVYAYGCTNVAITGKGTLRAYEGRWEDTKWYSWVPQKNEIKAARLQLYVWGATDHPVERREVWKMPNAHTRPHFIQFNRCRNVRLENFKVRNSPFWTIHLYQCEDATARGLDVYAHGNNNDGIDVEMSKNVLVEKCVFDQGDDGVVIKSGRNRDAWRIGKPTENVLVRDCEIRNAHTVLGIGSEISGGVRNVRMKDCTAGDVNRVFYLKTNRRRGGFLENITCENVTARSAKTSVFEITTDVLYEWADFPDYENRTTRISGIRAENICVDTAKDVVKICGDPSMPPSGVKWRNVSAGSVSGDRLFLKNAGNARCLDIDERVEEVLSRLSLKEKIGQLWQYKGGQVTEAASGDRSRDVLNPDFLDAVRAGRFGSLLGKRGLANYNAIQRAAMEGVGIPLLVGHDMIHSARTCYPIPLALSCSWDESLWERVASAMAVETLSLGCNWTFAPMIDVALDARWGRIAESGGSDPFVTGLMGAAMVRGFQGADMSDGLHIAACAKHFAGYGACLGGRDYNAVEMGDSLFRNTYLPPFRAAVDAGVATVMPAFHAYNGTPCSANVYLLRDVLRGELAFDGITISDCYAVTELVKHGVAADEADAAALAVNAGMDIEMASSSCVGRLEALVGQGRVPMKAVDDAVRNVLRVKFRLGLFDHPEIDEKMVHAAIDPSANRALAREAAWKSTVLLKNQGGTLPLKPGAKVSLIGDVASSDRQMLGTWSTHDMSNFENATLLAGLRADGTDVEYARAYALTGAVDVAGVARAVEGADVVVAAFGEYWEKSGENNSSSRIELSPGQIEVARAVKAAGKPLVAVLFGGRPMAFPELAGLADAVVVAWNPGGCGGWGVADVLTGRAEPWGRLTVDMPYATGTCPQYYSRTTTGRPAVPPGGKPADEWSRRWGTRYNDAPSGALYPFGCGLAYTEFAYSNEAVTVLGEDVVFSADVSNTGDRRGTELVQVYVHDDVARIARPRRELKGFRRVELDAGETRHVEIRVPARALGYWHGRRYVVDPGSFTGWIARDSDSGRALKFSLAR